MIFCNHLRPYSYKTLVTPGRLQGSLNPLCGLGSGFRVQGLGFRVRGLRFRVCGIAEVVDATQICSAERA